jgi:hypothetical protein
MANPLRVAPKLVTAAVAITLLTAFFLLTFFIRPSGCSVSSVNLDLELDQSRSAILQRSASGASDRCAAYLAHTALLESKKKCTGGRDLTSISSELAAYEQLITKTCPSPPT